MPSSALPAELAVRRERQRRQDGGRTDEPVRHVQGVGHRPVRLSSGRARSGEHPSDEPDRGTLARPLEAVGGGRPDWPNRIVSATPQPHVRIHARPGVCHGPTTVVFGQGGSGARVGPYARVSTHEQQTWLLQLSGMREDAEHRGWTIATRVEDFGSRVRERPKREHLIRAARRRHLDLILVWRLDRWRRSRELNRSSAGPTPHHGRPKPSREAAAPRPGLCPVIETRSPLADTLKGGDRTHKVQGVHSRLISARVPNRAGPSPATNGLSVSVRQTVPSRALRPERIAGYEGAPHV
jgi:hypothetical protein